MPQRRLANWVVVTLALLLLAYLLLWSPYYQGWRSLQLLSQHGHFVPIVEAEPFPPFGGDFLSEWLGGALVRTGDGQRLYDMPYVAAKQHDPEFMGVDWDRGQFLYLFYPPAYYLLMAPLSLLPIQLAAMLWLCLMMASLIAAVALLARACPEPWGLFAGALLAALVSTPAQISMSTGQKGTLWLLILSATFLLLRRERPFAAGLVFGLLAFKPPLTLAIGLTMLCKREWRFVAGSFVTLAAVIGISLAMGPDVCVAYVKSITGTVNFTMDELYPLSAEHSGYGFFALLLRSAHLSHGVIQALGGLIGLSAFLAVLLLCRGPLAFREERFTLQFAGLVLATALMSLKLQGYDLTILLLAMFLLARLAALPETEYEPYRPHLVLAAALLFMAGLGSERIAQRVPIQLSVPVTLGVLIFLVWVDHKCRLRLGVPCEVASDSL